MTLGQYETLLNYYRMSVAFIANEINDDSHYSIYARNIMANQIIKGNYFTAQYSAKKF